MELKSDDVWLGEGWVSHARPKSLEGGRTIRANSFRYPIFNVLIPVNNHPVVGLPSVLSVDAMNYLEGGGKSLGQEVQEFLEINLNYRPDSIWLQTLPRMFGYVFNPVSFWFCYKAGCLDAVLVEVNNTFGDRHHYFLDDLKNSKTPTRVLKKDFHVSPFFPIAGHYEFEFFKSMDRSLVKISLKDGEQLKLYTEISLNLRPIRGLSSFYFIGKYGWLTPMVVLKIHYQALKLWWKGAKFYSRPLPPSEKITGPVR